MRNRITNLADIFDREEESRAARYYASYGGFNFNRSLAKQQRINDKINYAFESLEEIENDRETMANICDQLDYNISLGKGISVESAAIINSNINNIYNRYGIVNKTAIVALEGFDNSKSRLEYTQKLRVSIEEGFFEKVKNVIKEIWKWIKKQWNRFMNWISGTANQVMDEIGKSIKGLEEADPNEQQVYSRSWYAKVKKLMAKFVNAFKNFFKGKTQIEKINEQLAKLDERERNMAGRYYTVSEKEVGVGTDANGRAILEKRTKTLPVWSTTFIVGPIAHSIPPIRGLVNMIKGMKGTRAEEEAYINSQRTKLENRKKELENFDQKLADRELDQISDQATKAADQGASLLTESQTNGEMLSLMKEMLSTFKRDENTIKETTNGIESLIKECEKVMSQFRGNDDKTTANRNRVITNILKSHIGSISQYVSSYYAILIAKSKETLTASKAKVEANDYEIQELKKAISTGTYTDSRGKEHNLNGPEGTKIKEELKAKLKRLEDQRKKEQQSYQDKYDKEWDKLEKGQDSRLDLLNRYK